MSQTPEPQEKKNRFSVSRQVQSEFVNDLVDTMLKLSDKVQAGEKPMPAQPPFCPVTGHAYGGASMTRLMLESIKQGYKDDRWLTFNQLQKYKFDNKDFKPTVRKGQHGVKLLRTEDVAFVVDDRGKWEFLTEDSAKERKAQGQKVQHKTVFYPYTVFNASQIDGFPSKEHPAPKLDDAERHALIEKFAACSAIPVEHDERPYYDVMSDTVKLPPPDKMDGMDEYQAMKLRLLYHATGHANRENRIEENMQPRFEEMRGEMFSLLAGARYGLPMPTNNADLWKNEIAGMEYRMAFEATADASRMLALMDQFARGEQPKAPWFPKQEEWPAMTAETATKQEMTPPAEPAPAPRMRM
ncbi:MAG: ssDNA-binding domain-containing protein [Desulfovibrio sp.]|jgi:antirestriction protein ArdC|nr:ssDNA-binding domain-containing protein [Desulfovibrio sp.]